VDAPLYRSFLSYSHRDAKWAAWLHKGLESYRPPRQVVGKATEFGPVPKRLTPIFKDREELATATDLGTVINEALRRSASQIVICSPRAAKSRWVNEEILAFKRLGREDRILCLIVDGEPNASDDPAQADQECFPPALRFRLGADGNLSDTRTEPIAADARPGKDGKSNAKLKLIAGVLGVGFNTLKQRETQRRNRQLFMIATAALAGMVLTSSLAAFALISRATAQRQTVRAEAEAETARQTTNFLVDLFRISDPGEARGNTVTAREMLDKGAARIATELAAQPAIQATLMDTVGTVYMGLGLYGKATPLLNAALAKRRSLEDLQPGALSSSLNHLGDLLSLKAEYDAAAKAYHEARQLQAAQPENPHLQAILAKSLYGLGIVLAWQGHYQEAERNLRSALDLQRRLYGKAHGDIARTLQNLAKVLDQAGNLNAAIPLMQSAVAMQRGLHGDTPHPDLAEEINDLGLLMQEKGDYGASEKLVLESIAMKRRLLGAKHPEIAMGLNNLAYVLQDKGDLVGAEATFREALQMQRELLGNVHPDVANTLNNLAFVQDDNGDLKGALMTERESLAIYRKLFAGDHPEVARIMNRIGYWLTRNGEYAEAEKDLKEALAMRRRLVGNEHPDVAGSLAHLAILQVATQKYQEALESARSSIEINTAALSASHWKTAVAQSAEGAALAGLGKYADAEKILKQSSSILNADMGASPTYRALAKTYLGDLYSRWRPPVDAQRHSIIKARVAQGTAPPGELAESGTSNK
jgi:tetratricopeptide (TPR) repeat protein